MACIHPIASGVLSTVGSFALATITLVGAGICFAPMVYGGMAISGAALTTIALLIATLALSVFCLLSLITTVCLICKFKFIEKDSFLGAMGSFFKACFCCCPPKKQKIQIDSN